MKRLGTVVLVLLVVSLLTAYAAETKKKEPPAKQPPAKQTSITVTATVATKDVNGKKVVILTAEDGSEYEVVPGAQAIMLAKLDGKKVKVTGTVKEEAGQRMITVKSFSRIKEEKPK